MCVHICMIITRIIAIKTNIHVYEMRITVGAGGHLPVHQTTFSSHPLFEGTLGMHVLELS